MVEELGITQRLFEADVFAGLIELLEGDAAAAERLLRGAYDGLRDLGLGIDAARAGALLARALLAQDRDRRGGSALARERGARRRRSAGRDRLARRARRGAGAARRARRGGRARAGRGRDRGRDRRAARSRRRAPRARRGAARRRPRRRGRRRGASRHRAVGGEGRDPARRARAARRARTCRAGARSRPPRRAAHAAGGTPPRAAERGDRDGIAASTPPSPRGDLDALAALAQRRLPRARSPDGIRRTVARRRSLRSGACSGRAIHIYAAEPLATLGESPGARPAPHGVRAGQPAAATTSARTRTRRSSVVEVDEHGPCRAHEVFAADHLGAAIARLYERYAELLPEGPERERAAATARARSARTIGRSIPITSRRCLRPVLRVVDHRDLGTWSHARRGGASSSTCAPAARRSRRIVAHRIEDVLASRPMRSLARCAHFGTARDSGGAVRATVSCSSFAFGADGRVARSECSTPTSDAEALARFDALSRRGDRARTRRRPAACGRTRRPRCGPASRRLAARDFDAVAAASSRRSYREIDHPTGSTYGRDAAIASHPAPASDRAIRTTRLEPLATLGERLLLSRRRTRASGDTRGRYDVGPYENEAIQLVRGRRARPLRRAEVFAADRLGDAIARLYERYAELLPEGPERERAAATARSMGTMLTTAPDDLERVAAVIAPDFESVDHRHLSTWSMRGGAAFVEHLRALLEVAADVVIGTSDVLALEPSALLIRRMHSGTERLGGGAYERPFLRAVRHRCRRPAGARRVVRRRPRSRGARPLRRADRGRRAAAPRPPPRARQRRDAPGRARMGRDRGARRRCR